ncbi:T. brucei spp.-specific protein [Trypanosoma brucei gambiense DAL972]|uniref:T. brucei spp.-specific protein n=1 Tax=Trypanosoma brucei gambiense (strain MHOM/CI/86/DAL972) TaxID=679716 RepID=C9ZWL3_TRYB9|nr:T. brucei spp.-specific protein [Trypanosoma brucei gambiense DAL972]CBH13802.1 T. brucei spp.-specific protein [Trypanosoma brucei gambiense DAL972]|eukprot:XP_011776078.1 T. brucei spp.-specific protein [Trypanosoma brucei gambiense DAL972]
MLILIFTFSLVSFFIPANNTLYVESAQAIDHECKARAAKHRESKGRKTHSDMPPHRKHPARGRSPRNKRYNGEGKPATKRGRSWSKQPSGPLTTNCDGEASSYTTAGTPPVASDHKFCKKTRSTKPSLEVTRTHIAPNTTTAAEVIPNASVTSAVGSAGGTETAATPTAKGADNLSDTDMEKYNDLQRLLRRIIALEFSERCTQRSITVVTMICETLCTDPVAIVKVMEVVDQCFGEAVRGQEPRLLMHYWYILDAILKHFNGKPHLLKAVLVAIPHFVRQYLPWRGSTLAGQPWSEYDKYRPAYEDMLGTWKVVLEERALEEIMKLWREGMGNHYADKVGDVGARVPLGNATADSQNSDAAH